MRDQKPPLDSDELHGPEPLRLALAIGALLLGFLLGVH